MPSAEQTGETLELVLRLYREWAEGGLRPEEIDFSKGYLRKSHAFTIQTADDRLGLRTAWRSAVCPSPTPATSPTASPPSRPGRARRHGRRPSPRRAGRHLGRDRKDRPPSSKKIAALKHADIEVVPFDSF